MNIIRIDSVWLPSGMHFDILCINTAIVEAIFAATGASPTDKKLELGRLTTSFKTYEVFFLNSVYRTLALS